ncbi:hypothetical protein Plhal703r1_c13g0065911 [Plasmopara halstedii]
MAERTITLFLGKETESPGVTKNPQAAVSDYLKFAVYKYDLMNTGWWTEKPDEAAFEHSF